MWTCWAFDQIVFLLQKYFIHNSKTPFNLIIIKFHQIHFFHFFFLQHKRFVVTVTIACSMHVLLESVGCWSIQCSLCKKNINDRKNTTRTHIHFTIIYTPKAPKSTQTSFVARKLTAILVIKNSQEFKMFIPFRFQKKIYIFFLVCYIFVYLCIYG